ncbi:hypothetical protein LY76DRAFT_633042 [Colletotrichum caudatum]|nr:hypothetical protein LY76DRAFT_633042 [Colletotrichum caudatum]
MGRQANEAGHAAGGSSGDRVSVYNKIRVFEGQGYYIVCIRRIQRKKGEIAYWVQRNSQAMNDWALGKPVFQAPWESKHRQATGVADVDLAEGLAALVCRRTAVDDDVVLNRGRR